MDNNMETILLFRVPRLGVIVCSTEAHGDVLVPSVVASVVNGLLPGRHAGFVRVSLSFLRQVALSLNPDVDPRSLQPLLFRASILGPLQ